MNGGTVMTDRNKEIDIIIREIEKTRQLFPDMDKYIIVKINQDKDTDYKTYDFTAMFNDDIDSIESTHHLTVLNGVMKYLLNQDYVLDFSYELY